MYLTLAPEYSESAERVFQQYAELTLDRDAACIALRLIGYEITQINYDLAFIDFNRSWMKNAKP